MKSVNLTNYRKLYDVDCFNYEQEKESNLIVKLSKKHLKNDQFNILDCLPYHIRSSNTERIEAYRAAYPIQVPLFSVLSVRKRENIKDLGTNKKPIIDYSSYSSWKKSRLNN